MVLTTQAGSMETMCLTTQEGQLGSNGLVKCLCAHVLALGPQQLPSWALLTPTSLPAPPLLLMGLLPPCLPHQTPHLPPAPQLAQAISSRCHLCKVHTLTLNVMPECPSKPAQMPKAPAHRRARAAAVGEGTSAGVCPGLEGCPEGERRVPLAESFMLAGRLGQCSRGACFMAPSLAGKQGTQVTSLKQGTPPPTQIFPKFVLAERLPSPGECCQEPRCLCSLATGFQQGPLLWSPRRVQAAVPRDGFTWLGGRC